MILLDKVFFKSSVSNTSANIANNHVMAKQNNTFFAVSRGIIGLLYSFFFVFRATATDCYSAELAVADRQKNRAPRQRYVWGALL